MKIRQLLVNDHPDKHHLIQYSDNSIHINHHLKSERPLISVVIPVYNEVKSIKNVIDRIPNHQRYEIILVDDGSTDKSFEKVKVIKNRYIKVVKHKSNKGYGAAILTGIKYATGDIIVTMDSDGQHNPEEIQKLIKPIINKQADIVIGSRYLGQCNYKIPLHTRVGEYFIDFFLWHLFGKNVKNNQSGFRAFNKRSLEVFNDLIYNKFGLCTEILFKAALNNLKIKEIPITVDPRKYGMSYICILKIFISISSCILIYGLKKFKILNFIPNALSRRISKRLVK